MLKLYYHFEEQSEVQKNLLSYKKYAPFRIAAKKGHLKVLQKIYDLADEPIKKSMMNCYDCEAYRWTIKKGYGEMADQLLEWASQKMKRRMERIG